MAQRAEPVLVVGAGIAGLATALALAQRGIGSRLVEQSPGPRLTGAGLQLAPNAVRILKALGLAKALKERSFAPTALCIRDFQTHREIGRLPLGARCQTRYGEHYLTIHRGDLIQALLSRVQEMGIHIEWSCKPSVSKSSRPDPLISIADEPVRAPVIVGADGVWSSLRAAVPAAQGPVETGQEALRAVIDKPVVTQDKTFSSDVTVWTRPGLHVVGYPIRGGESYSLVVIRDQQTSAKKDWDHSLSTEEVAPIFEKSRGFLRDLFEQAPGWQSWPLMASSPLPSGRGLGQGRVALVGDAAHPLRPHLAQGAAMALEDAWRLADSLAWRDYRLDNPEEAIARYADQRWRRVSRVQRQSARSGRIFQLGGMMASARNFALRLAPIPLMDQPWLYRVSEASSREH